VRTLVALLGTLTALTLLPSVAAAQWTAELQVGGSRFWGTSRELGVEAPHSFRPYRPTTIGLRLERTAGALTLAFTGYNAGTGFALEGDDGAILANGVLTVTGIQPEADFRIAMLPGAGRIALGAGPLLEVWGVQSASSRTRFGGHAAAILEVPLGGRLRAAVRGGMSVLPSSILNDDEVTSGYERRATWRRSLTLGLGYRL